MRLSRSDLVPVLAIIAGGAIGMATFSSVMAPSATVEPAIRVPAQVGTVTGRVTDASSGSPLAAAQVYITSPELGGLSQQNGGYLLQNVPAGTHTLHVARMGYRTTEAQVTVDGGQTVEQNFSVAEEALQLDEVAVVVPAATQCLSDLEEEISLINTRIEAERRVAPPPGRRLERGSSITIRGYSSIPIANQPIYVVDGVRYNYGDCFLADLDPDDVEDTELLRSAAAVRRFGEEASNGAIVITLTEARRRR